MASREEIMKLFKEYAPRIRKSIQMREDVSSKKIKTAIKSYAHDADSDKVLGMLDASFWGTGSQGDLFTEDACYFGFWNIKCSVHYDRVSHVEVADKTDIRVYFKNGDTQRLSPLHDAKEVSVIVEYINKMIELVNRSSTGDYSGIKNGDVIKISRKGGLYFHYGIYV